LPSFAAAFLVWSFIVASFAPALSR
jgi:hypothetical protein